MHRRLTEAASEWRHAGRDEGLLYRGARLAEALEWWGPREAILNETERAFLNASAALQARERSGRDRLRRRITAASVAVAGPWSSPTSA
jgi:hypothetical protein